MFTAENAERAGIVRISLLPGIFCGERIFPGKLRLETILFLFPPPSAL